MDFEEVDTSDVIYLTYIDPPGKHTQLWDMRIIDPKHPQCGFCGRFVKLKWDHDYSGPCTFCDEFILFL